MRGSACSKTTVTKTNTTGTMTTIRRMERGCAGDQTTGGNPTTTVATSFAGPPLAAWGGGC
jgi:hypothetical protein